MTRSSQGTKSRLSLLLGLTHCQQANPSNYPSNPIAGRSGGAKQHATHHCPENQLPVHHRHARSFWRKPPRLEATTSTRQYYQSGVTASNIQVKRTSALLAAKPLLRIARRLALPVVTTFTPDVILMPEPLLGHVIRGHGVLRKVVVVLWTGGVGCSTKALVSLLLLGNLCRLVIGV